MKLLKIGLASLGVFFGAFLFTANTHAATEEEVLEAEALFAQLETIAQSLSQFVLDGITVADLRDAREEAVITTAQFKALRPIVSNVRLLARQAKLVVKQGILAYNLVSSYDVINLYGLSSVRINFINVAIADMLADSEDNDVDFDGVLIQLQKFISELEDIVVVNYGLAFQDIFPNYPVDDTDDSGSETGGETGNTGDGVENGGDIGAGNGSVSDGSDGLGASVGGDAGGDVVSI